MITISGYTKVTLENVTLKLWYVYNKENGDIEEAEIYVPIDNREENGITDIVWPHYETEITRAIREAVKNG